MRGSLRSASRRSAKQKKPEHVLTLTDFAALALELEIEERINRLSRMPVGFRRAEAERIKALRTKAIRLAA